MTDPEDIDAGMPGWLLQSIEDARAGRTVNVPMEALYAFAEAAPEEADIDPEIMRLAAIGWQRGVTRAGVSRGLGYHWHELEPSVRVEEAHCVKAILEELERSGRLLLAREHTSVDTHAFVAEHIVFTQRTVLDPKYIAWCARCEASTTGDEPTVEDWAHNHATECAPT